MIEQLPDLSSQGMLLELILDIPAINSIFGLRIPVLCSTEGAGLSDSDRNFSYVCIPFVGSSRQAQCYCG